MQPGMREGVNGSIWNEVQSSTQAWVKEMALMNESINTRYSSEASRFRQFFPL